MNIATQMNQKKSNERQESHQCTNPKCICPLGERPLAFELAFANLGNQQQMLKDAVFRITRLCSTKEDDSKKDCHS
jgi:hypothetical protein